MTGIAQIFPDPRERQQLEEILQREGFTHAWVLDDGDRAEFFLRVSSTELSRVSQRDVSIRLSEALPGRKVWITSHTAEGEEVTLF